MATSEVQQYSNNMQVWWVQNAMIEHFTSEINISLAQRVRTSWHPSLLLKTVPLKSKAKRVMK